MRIIPVVLVLSSAALAACGALLGLDDEVERPIRNDGTDAGTAHDAATATGESDGSIPTDGSTAPDADAGPPKKHVFITSGRYAGVFDGGRAGADTLCTAIANGAGRPGTFKAYLAEIDGGHPSDRIVKREFVRFDEALVFPNGPGPAVSPLVPILIGEDGGELTDFANKYAWTGLEKFTPVAERTCEGWTGGSGPTAFAGRGDMTNGGGSDSWQQSAGTDSCTNENRLYCFED